MVFFDRDNTLIVSDGYLKDPARVRLMPGAASAVARARRLGYAVAVVSNQSGVGRGLLTEADVHAVNRRMDELLVAEDPDALIDVHYFCPFHPEADLPQYRLDSDLRKPRPGMILQGLSELGAVGGFCIGDAPRDVAAGHAAGLTTLLFVPEGVSPSPAAGEDLGVAPDHTVTTLDHAMDIIERLTTPSPRPPQVSTTSASGGGGGGGVDTSKLEQRLDAILAELKRAHLHDHDFSVARLFAGIAQVMAVAVAVVAYVSPPASGPVIPLLLAIFLQGLVTSLLLMGRK